ncbi:MAG: hypothetical protein IPL99_15775 [Candidatus Competibacteraceae bacterium]|nr:hypothetical protein [Candidatus Competibacteraceae bacterium]
MKKLPSRPLPNSLNKYVSAPTLLNQARKAFEKIPDARRYGQQFSLPDVLMSGLAVFGLKFPSLLKFDEQRNEERIRANLKSLYGVKQAPVTRNFGRYVIRSIRRKFGRHLFTLTSDCTTIIF